MKTMLKVMLMIAFLGSSVLADGQMGGGGCNENCPPPPPPCTENCGRPSQLDEKTSTRGTSYIVLTLVRRYFFRF
jgi:hypothetical protein